MKKLRRPKRTRELRRKSPRRGGRRGVRSKNRESAPSLKPRKPRESTRKARPSGEADKPKTPGWTLLLKPDANGRWRKNGRFISEAEAIRTNAAIRGWRTRKAKEREVERIEEAKEPPKVETPALRLKSIHPLYSAISPNAKYFLPVLPMTSSEIADVSAIVALDQNVWYPGLDGRPSRLWIVDRLYLGKLDVEAVLALKPDEILAAYEAAPKPRGAKGVAVKVLCVVKLKPREPASDPGPDQAAGGGSIPPKRAPAQARAAKRR